jgi:hypothetical protein
MTFKKSLLMIEIILNGWILVYHVKRTKLPVTDYLDRKIAKRKPKNGLDWDDVRGMIRDVFARFRIHKKQPCLVQSLVEYYYLKLFGHDPYFVFNVNLHSRKYYNCHAWVTDSETLNKMSNNPGDGLHQVGSSRTYIREK